MKIWKRVILGVVFSFVAFFTCLGYAALTDQLSITGTISASMPKELFISDIKKSGSPSTGSSIIYPTTITVAESGIYEITVCNNTTSRYVYTGSEPTVTVTDTADGSNIGTATKSSDDPYVYGTNLKEISPKTTDGPTFVTFYVLCDSAAEISFDFQKFIYKITYINKSTELDTRYVYDNSEDISTENKNAVDKALPEVQKEFPNTKNIEFLYWMNAGSSAVPTVDKDNTNDIKLYPKFNPVFTVMFVDHDGNILAWCNYTSDDKDIIDDKRTEAETELNKIMPENCSLDYWQVYVTKNGKTTKVNYADYNFADDVDVTIYPVYEYDGSVNLIPVDEDSDGDTDYYLVGGYKNDEGVAFVEIPSSFNSKKVDSVNANAFASYPDLHVVTIPTNVTNLGDHTFAEEWGTILGRAGETQTIYYEGSYQDWLNKMSYSKYAFNGLSSDTRIYFLNYRDKVDPSQGYLQVQKVDKDDGWFSTDYVGELVYYDKSNIDQTYINQMYTSDCTNCDIDHTKTNQTADNRRPDYIYWGAADGSGAITLSN